jgi:hypothetical protein
LGRKLFPAPLSKNSQRGILFFAIIIAFDRRAVNVSTALHSLPLEGKVSTQGSEASDVVDG